MAEPKVRFKRDDGSSYPAWVSGKLGDITEKVNRKAPKGSTAPVMMVSQSNGFIYQADKYSRENAGQSLKNYTLLKQGEFAYNHGASKAKPYGVAYCLMEESEARVPFVYHTFKIKDGVNSYWHEALNTSKMDRQLKRMVSSGARMDGLLNINYETYMDVAINIPCEEEQQKIADFLSTVDEVISTSEAEVTNLEKQKKAVMKKIFSQEVRFKREDGSEFPGWEEAALNDISERIIVGLATTVTPYYRENGVPMFRNLNIRAGYLDDSNMLYLDEEYASKQGGKFIHAGDILTVHTGNIGWSCVVPDCYEGALSFTTLITTLKSNGVTNDYVCAYLNSDLGIKQMQDLAFSGGRANLNTSEFQKVIVPIPCFEEQCLIADFLSSFDEAIAAAKKELELWKELKKGLLQQMFV